MSPLLRSPARRRAMRLLWLPLLLALAGCAALGLKQPPPLPVSQIVAMSKAGTPVDEIIRRIQDSGTVYRLTAGQITDLSRRGVPEPVLDYMLDSYVEAVRRDQRLQDWSEWNLRGGYWYWHYPYP